MTCLATIKKTLWGTDTVKKCARCETRGNARLIHIHHKDRNRKNNELNNLILLCIECHWREHKSNKKIKTPAEKLEIYMNKLREKINNLEKI